MKLFIKQVAIELNSNNILFNLLLLLQDDAIAKLAITLFKKITLFLRIERQLDDSSWVGFLLWL